MLGEGGFKKVSDVLCLNNMKYYAGVTAIKENSPDRNTIIKGGTKNIQAEIKKIKNLHDLGIPNIIPLHKVSFHSKTKKGEPKFGYITEKCKGDVLMLFNDDERLGTTTRNALNILCDVSNATAAMHAKNKTHCDLKPDNVLIDIDPKKIVKKAYLMDFDGLRSADGRESMKIYTPDYLPPEFASDGTATPEKDNYALGIMAIELLLSRPNPLFMFKKEGLQKKYVDKITLDKEKLDENEASSIRNTIKDNKSLQEFMMDVDEELINRKVFQSENSRIEYLMTVARLLNPDPKGRMTSKQAHKEFSKILSELKT